MLKHIVHLFFFAVGAGVGIWWGVNHPTQAQNVAAMEEAKIQDAINFGKAQGKQQALQTVQADQVNAPTGTPPASPAATSHLQQMIKQAQDEYNSAKGKMGQ